jgi:hypothetical protein
MGTWSNLELDRPAVAGYLEAFILVGVAMGASALVYSASVSYLAGASGPSVGISSASIVQGSASAVERVTVANAGGSPLTGFGLDTEGAPPGATYCYYLQDPATGARLTSKCPGALVEPGAAEFTATVPPGASLTVVLVIAGAGFVVGSAHQVSVVSSNGAGAVAEVRVVPA